MRSKTPGYFMLVCGLEKENGSRGCCTDLPGKGKWSIFEGGLGASGVRSRIKGHSFISKASAFLLYAQSDSVFKISSPDLFTE